eukprot:NODE_187_length_2376_cov_253.021787_g172_i1.p1 GENE.NODE_187_length_2376_cov_253.021787_g172_i1~~NODE_187_length_2376_cov_253.021787_g172_i1.p1  ORF type:complete len:744 (-),score=222.77 NODE_187_length_2376_cov_253.021787_g172_i1:145-2082(-)
MEYKVGPFPGPLTVTALTAPNEIAFEARQRDGKIINAIKRYIAAPELAKLDTLMQESFGLTWPNGLNLHATAPAGYTMRDRLERCFIVLDIPGTSRVKDLFPFPLTFRVAATGSDPNNWAAEQWFYARQGPYDTADQLAAAYAAGNVEKVTYPAGYQQRAMQYAYPVRENGRRSEFSDLPGPSTFYPAGKRYTVAGRMISWMGWSLHATSEQKRGPVLHDIRFKGERIAYEVAVQDVSLVYSANDPVQGNVMYFDGSFAIGETSDHIPDVDCPPHADFLANNWYNGGPYAVARAACIYEQPTGGAAWRRKEGVMSGMRDSNLILKFQMPVGNYDYIAEYQFGLGGDFHVHYKASGNIQTYPYIPSTDAGKEVDGMGVRFFERSYGAMHDHSFSIKVDMDVLGTANNFVTHEYKMGEPSTVPRFQEMEQANANYVTAYANDANKKRPKYIESRVEGANMYRYFDTVKQTTEIGFQLNLLEPKVFTFEPADDTPARLNKWGVPRSYKIHQHCWSDVNQYADQHPIMVGGQWRNKNLAVSLRKETEQNSGSGNVLWALDDPSIKFEDMFDGENIVGKDLVAWVSFGFLHLPRAEDSPVQPVVGGGFSVEPNNYFDENPQFDLPHLVYDMGRGESLQEQPEQEACKPDW